MTKEDLILERLEKLEAEFVPMAKAAKDLNELKNDLSPLGNQAVRILIEELQEVEAAFQLDDLFILIKEIMRNVRNFTFAIKQLDNIIEFITDLEPLLKTAVPQLIEYLDDLERKGVPRMMKAMVDVRAKVAATYDIEDIDQIGDAFVALLGMAKNLSDPKAKAFLSRISALPAQVDLENCKQVGTFGLLSAPFNSELKAGLGVMMELTKVMGRIESNGNGDQPTAPQSTAT